MATTHVLAGLVLAAGVATVVPGVGPVVALAAAAGGAVPDLDLYAGHRRTLHFPVYYGVAAAGAALVAAAVPGTWTLAAALFLAAAALHSVMDAAGGGLELRPWLATSDRAVYSHFHGRWLPPKRWVRYDGAPEDLALGVALAVPAVVAFDGQVQAVAVGAVAVSAVYTLLRKPSIEAAAWLVGVLPERVVARVPEQVLDVDEL